MRSSRVTDVLGVYLPAYSVEKALDDLIRSGFSCSDISLLLPDRESTRAFLAEKCASTSGSTGGGLGPLAGLCEFSIPGVGAIIAGGPILSAITGIAAGGTIGGLVGELIGMGIPEYEARLYEGAVRDGAALLSIHCEATERICEARGSLERTGARDIVSTSEAISEEIEGGCIDCGTPFDGDTLLERGSLAESAG